MIGSENTHTEQKHALIHRVHRFPEQTYTNLSIWRSHTHTLAALQDKKAMSKALKTTNGKPGRRCRRR